jgi:hypothetical protein
MNTETICKHRQDWLRETLINSEFPRATDGALADQARKRLIRREWTQAWPESTTSEPRQDGVVQTFLSVPKTSNGAAIWSFRWSARCSVCWISTQPPLGAVAASAPRSKPDEFWSSPTARASFQHRIWRAQWISLTTPKALSDGDTKALMRRSYEPVFAKLPKSKQRELGGA